MRPIIESIREYIAEFPGLRDGCILVDILGSEAVGYTVEAVPCEPIYKKYTDGSCIRQFLFIFASREYFGEDVRGNTENLAFYEELEHWIESRSEEGILPELGRYAPISLEVLTRGYAFSAGIDTARYQIQLRLLYEEE